MSNTKDEAFCAYLTASGKDSNLLVNNLPINMMEQELARLFSGYGALEIVKIARNLRTGVSKCYGFVKFKKLCDAIAAQFQLNGRLVGDKSLKVDFARLRFKEAKNTTLYVTNLPLGYNKKKVSFVFQLFGAIKRVRVLPQKSIGVLSACVEFRKSASAEAARREMSHKRLTGSQKPLVIKAARLRTKKED